MLVRKENRLVLERYTSFRRWALDMEKSYSGTWRYSVASTRYKHPSFVWNNDLYGEATERVDRAIYHYYVVFSESPVDGDISFNIFKEWWDPDTSEHKTERLFHTVCNKLQLNSEVQKANGVLPNNMFNALVSALRRYSF